MRNWVWFSDEEIASWPPEHKKCRSCARTLPFSEFHKNRHTLFGYNTECKECRIPKSKVQYHEKDYRQLMFERAKSRAARKGLSFTITKEDIIVPESCPIFGTSWGVSPPSLDRIDPTSGYDKGNIQVISTRANTLKNNATLSELETLVEWMRKTTI